MLTRILATIVRREGRFAIGLLPPAALGSGFGAVPSSVFVHATVHHGDQEEGHEAEDGLHRKRRHRLPVLACMFCFLYNLPGSYGDRVNIDLAPHERTRSADGNSNKGWSFDHR